ncbi:MAG TPA: Mpo1-like protein [Burkholderiaceae bacterium]
MAATPFRPALDLMSQYAEYHRDKRNIATHFVGIPLIVFAIGILLARASIGGFTLAWIVWALATAWYLTRGNLVLGVATSVVNAMLIALAHPFAGVPLVPWLAWGIGFFVLGWLIQFIGHYYEGRKPAFVDDVVGLLVGPMFVVGEWLFALGWGHDMLAEIERRAGPTHLRDLAAPATR